MKAKPDRKMPNQNETTRAFYRLGNSFFPKLKGHTVLTEKEIGKHFGMSRELAHYHITVALGKLIHGLQQAMAEQ
jgi:hypothetical protein